MESGNGCASSKGVLVPVSESSAVFQNNILAPLKSAYLYEESKQSFRYKSAVLLQNQALEEKYYAFRAKRKEAGYSEEELKESYGFLLFDDVNKANALGETGVLTGNSTCTTLGDPSNGVYISMYSDCLDLNRWYHGKSGYIAIIRLTKGKVKKVLENYTQNFTAPTVGFDCHVSEQLPSVSAKTSSFLAFDRTQYYMYELLDDGSNATTQSPSAAYPFAIVSFSYTDTKATLLEPQEKSEDKKLVYHYIPWKGQLQIGTQFYDVGLRLTSGALIPAELPPVVKIERAISMRDLRQLLPRAAFETCFTGEVFLDGLYCSLCELVSSEAEQTNSLSLLLQEIKEKELALTVPLNDGGFLILLHSSHFLTYDDTGSSTSDVLQGIFVFPVSQVIQRDTKSGQRKPAMSTEILRVLPVLTYAEGEIEKTPIDSGEELGEVLVQHMQRYAALINPGLALSPSKEVSIFPDQYDVPDAHKHLYSSPEWTNRAWQSVRSYLSKPVSYQLPVSKASEILAAGQEERMEDLDDDVYICLSSPEEAPSDHVSMESEDQSTGQILPVKVEKSVDSSTTSAEAQVDLTALPQNVVPDKMQAVDVTKNTGKSDLTVLIKRDDIGAKNLVTSSTSDELPAELIVSITSAERTVTDASLSMISTVSATKDNEFQLSGFSTAKLQTAGVNSLNDETVASEKVLDCPAVTSLTKTKRRKLRRGYSKVRKKVSKACSETPSVQLPVQDENLKSQKVDQAKESSGHPQLTNPPNIDQRKGRGRKRNFRKLPSRTENVGSVSVGLAVPEENKSGPVQQTLESTILMELEAGPLRKKTERWDLKPVISECGRILVPHGSVDVADQIKSLKNKLQPTKDEQSPEKMLVDASVNAHDTVEMEQESSKAPETAADKTDATTSKDGENHLQNIVVSEVKPECSVLRASDDGNGSLTMKQESNVHFSKTDSPATPPSEAVKEKRTNTLSPGKIATKGEFLLSKLKTVLLRGKRKTDLHLSEERTADTAQDTEPCLKKGRVDPGTGMLKCNYSITSVQDPTAHVKEVSKLLSVDPLFAYALGLTPKEPPNKVQNTESQDAQQRTDSSENKDQTILEKQPRIMQRPPSIFPRRGRIKMLKKHQGISTEYVKKKWWLHFQTPACFAAEKLKYKECTRDNSVRKTVKEKMNSACSSTDALNLLADLALSANNDQVPPQPDPALERKPETSLKKCDLTKDVTSAEQESVLHTLLRQPAGRPMQPLESSSPSHLVEGSELVGLVSKEHAYSLPPSSSLLLGLPGTPFQVSPLSGSTRLLHHHQTMYGDENQTLQPSVGQEDRSEQNRTPEYLKKHMVRRRKFRHSRTFVDKDGSIQVTKQWKENYDFNLDSRFSSDLKDRAVIRALHGPWDFSMQDTSEEVRLIVHMWIGLFYSRSTDRLFHVDSYPCYEKSNYLEKSSGMLSPAQSETQLVKANSFAAYPSVTDTSDSSILRALDLSKKEESVLDQGPVILDLSLKKSNAEIVTSDLQVSRKDTSVSGDQREASETLETPKSSVKLQESKIQCYKNIVQSTEIINEVNDGMSTFENKSMYASLQNAESQEHTDVPSSQVDGTTILGQEEMGSVSVPSENNQTASGIGHVLTGCNNEKTDMKDDIENLKATEVSLGQKHERDSSKSVTDKEADSNKEAGDMVRTVGHDETESKDGKNWIVKVNSYQEDCVEPSPEVIYTDDDSTKKVSDVICNGSLLENEKMSSGEEPKAVSIGKVENANEDVDGCTVHKSKVTEDKHHFGREDQLNEKDGCISAVEADRDSSDQPVPMLCEGDRLDEKDSCISAVESDRDSSDQPEPMLCEEDQLDEKESCISAMQADRDSSDQPVPLLCDDPDLEKKDCITESNHKPESDEQPPHAVNKQDTCHDLQLRKLYANGNVLTDEHAISEKSHTSSEMELISREPTVEDSSENGSMLTEEHAISEKSHTSPEMELISREPTVEDSSENGSVLTEDHAISEKSHNSPEMELISREPTVEDSSENGSVLTEHAMSEKSHTSPEMELFSREPTVEDSSENGNVLIDEHAISEKSHTSPEIELFSREPTVEDNSENGSVLIDEHAISEKSHTSSEMELISREPTVEDSSENDSVLTEEHAIPEKSHNSPEMELFSRERTLEENSENGSVLTDEHGISEKSHTSLEIELISREPTVEENSENGICLARKAHCQKLATPKLDGNNCSLDDSCADGTIPQTNASVEIGNQNKVMANFNEGSDIHEDVDAQSIEGEHKDDTTTEKELFYCQTNLPKCKGELALTKETHLKQIDEANEALEKIYSGVVIPFIGMDTSGEDTVQPPESHSKDKVEEVGREKIPFISDTTYPETVLPVCTTSHMYSKKAELSAGKISLSLVSEMNQPVLSGNESDDRCPTPTMDEKPYEYLTCSGPSSTSASAFSGSETSKDMTDKCLGRDLEMPGKSTVNSDAYTHHGLPSDLEIRTLRVLKSIDQFLSKSHLTGKPSQIEKADMKPCLDQTPIPSRKSLPTCLAPSHTSTNIKDQKISNTTLAMVLASTSQELHRESTGHSLVSPCKSKLDKLQETSVGQDSCHPHRSVPCTESLLAIKPKTEQDRHKTTSQTNSSHEPRSYSQRPIMAVKPSKSDENEADGISKDRQIENSAMLHYSKNKQTKTPKVPYTTPPTLLLEKKTDSFKRTSEGPTNDKQESSELSSRSSWLSNLSDSKSDKAKFGHVDLLHHHQGRDNSKFNMLPSSSLPMQSFESPKSSSKLVEGNLGFMKYCLVEKVGKLTKESIEVDHKDHSEASTSRLDYKDGGIIDDSLFLGPESSLMCTVYNTSQKRGYSFLEQVSQRCLQDDLTEASMEQECLIFSEQMKQLLKRSKRGPVCQQDTHDKRNMSCSSPVTVHFCSLQEEEDSVDQLNAHLDLISLVGQKIKVDMSERKDVSDNKEEEKTLQPQKLSQGTGNPMEHAGISSVTSESASLYEAMMSDVCAVKKAPSRPKHFRMDRCNPKTEPSSHFDFCDQMKKEMDESFRSHLNSVVKKSCKTKYRFYILVTSDDAFFGETKVQLEAEGHTAVQPSEFFLDEDNSSSLLIILRNEDIAEHICEVQHLLKLKNSPHVQFVGIDEPDDVVNLTHQELFTRGGFIVFDRAALEPLSLCHMKKMKEILHELSRKGKWKWILHYRDSRRLKENARLSPEAKEKKHFLNLCQEDGILEVLPYHECDLMSREQPDYLTCLVRLQVQNISARYPVFITDATADSAFGKNGILTMTFDSFLTYSQSETFTA